MDQFVRKRDPPRLWNDLHQIALDLLWRTLLRQLQPPRQSHHMRIDDHPHSNPKPRTQHNISRLSSNPRKPQNLLHSLRNLSPKLLDDNPCRPLDRLRLIPKKSSGSNQLLQLGKGSGNHSLRVRKRLKQTRSHQIHPNIRALCRQNRRNGQFPRILMNQRTNYIRISLANPSRMAATRSGLVGFLVIPCLL